MEHNTRPSLLSFALLLLLSVIWGTSYILIKKGLVVFSAGQVGLLRLSLSGVAALPILIVVWRRIDWSKWRLYLLASMLGSGLPVFLFPLAQTHISSAAAGVLNALSPLLTLLLGVVIFGARWSGNKLLGILIGFVGAACLILSQNGHTSNNNYLYGLFAVAAAVSYAFNSNLVGYTLKGVSTFAINSVGFTALSIPALIGLFSTDFLTRLSDHPQGWTSFISVALLAVLSTVLASLLFYKLIQLTAPVFASTVSYIVPFVAILWGLFDGETLSIWLWLGAVLIIVGVYLAKR